MDSTRVYQKFKIRKVNIYEDVAQGEEKGVSPYHGLDIYYGDGLKMYRPCDDSHMYIRPDSLYRATDLRNTYSSINSLPSVGYSAVRFREVPTDVNLSVGADIAAFVCGVNLFTERVHIVPNATALPTKYQDFSCSSALRRMKIGTNGDSIPSTFRSGTSSHWNSFDLRFESLSSGYDTCRYGVGFPVTRGIAHTEGTIHRSFRRWSAFGKRWS